MSAPTATVIPFPVCRICDERIRPGEETVPFNERDEHDRHCDCDCDGKPCGWLAKLARAPLSPGLAHVECVCEPPSRF
jgi:hypothetical protein